MLKQRAALIALIIFYWVFTSTITYAQEKELSLDGETLSDATFLWREGHLYLPLRLIIEESGGRVTWENNRSNVSLEGKSAVISLGKEAILFQDRMYVARELLEKAFSYLVQENRDEAMWNVEVYSPRFLRFWDNEGNQKVEKYKMATGKGVKVAVFDSGIYPYSELHLKEGISFVGNKGEYDVDLSGHGTLVAGVLHDIAPDVELYSVRVMKYLTFGDEGYHAIIQGIDWAIEKKVDIINLSLYWNGDNAAFKRAVQRAIDHGIIVVVGAGNSGGVVSDLANVDGVLSVGALAQDLERKASFSSYLGKIDYMAPGEAVDPSFRAHDDYPPLVNGTSLSAPYVAGIFALYKELYPNLTPQELKRVVDENAKIIHEEGVSPKDGWKFPQPPQYQEDWAYLPSKDSSGQYVSVERWKIYVPQG